ncbi:MAG: DUF929 family protein [Candidatus Micrarchaeia archaeon]
MRSFDGIFLILINTFINVYRIFIIKLGNKMEAKEVQKVDNIIKRDEEHIERQIRDIRKSIKTLQVLTAVLVVIVVISIFYTYHSIGSISLGAKAPASGVTNTTPSSLSNNSAGQRLTNIGKPLTSVELAAINNASNSNFETAGEMIFNTTPGNPFEETYNNGTYIGIIYVPKAHLVNPYIINGKPSVIYLGAISCIYCAENRWAIALALSRFGTFNKLFTGYSSLGDGDVPTLYWNNDNYTTQQGVTFGNLYNSSYINFISADYDSPITAGFEFPQSGVSYFINAAPNATYKDAYLLINRTGLFEGTPFSIWGSVANSGVDAVIFGTPKPGESSNIPPISYMTHSQILAQIQSFNTTFAKEQYAAADVYIAELCPSINNSAQVCSLPAIQKLESVMGLNATKQ